MASQPKDELERALQQGDYDSLIKILSRNSNDSDAARLRTQVQDLFVKENSVLDNIYGDAKIVAEFTPNFKKLSEKQKVRYVVSDGRSSVLTSFVSEYLKSITNDNLLLLLKNSYNDQLAKVIWEQRDIKNLPRQLLLGYFKCSSEDFAVWLLTTQNMGGQFPQEVFLILVSKLSNSNSGLRDEVLAFIFKELKEIKEPEQLLRILPYCPRGQMENICTQLHEIMTKTVPSDALVGFLGDPSQVSPIPHGDKLQMQGALVTVPLTNQDKRIYSIRVGVHDTQKCDAHPITLCLLQTIGEFGNIFLESSTGEQTKCIGCLSKTNPLYKLPYPLPYLGRYGHFKLIISIDAKAEKIEPIPQVSQSRTVMILNPYHQGADPSRLQWVDVPVSEKTTFGNLLSQVHVMLNPNANNMGGFLNNAQPQYAIVFRDGRLCPPEANVLNFSPQGSLPVFLLVDAKKLSNAKQPAQNPLQLGGFNIGGAGKLI